MDQTEDHILRKGRCEDEPRIQAYTAYLAYLEVRLEYRNRRELYDGRHRNRSPVFKYSRSRSHLVSLAIVVGALPSTVLESVGNSLLGFERTPPSYKVLEVRISQESFSSASVDILQQL